MTLGGFGAASDKIFDARPNLLTPTRKIARAREMQRDLVKFYFLQVPRSKLPVAVALVILPVVPEAAWPRCPALVGIAEALTKGGEHFRPITVGRSGGEHANYRCSALLCACFKRPHCSTAGE